MYYRGSLMMTTMVDILTTISARARDGKDSAVVPLSHADTAVWTHAVRTLRTMGYRVIPTITRDLIVRW